MKDFSVRFLCSTFKLYLKTGHFFPSPLHQDPRFTISFLDHYQLASLILSYSPHSSQSDTVKHFIIKLLCSKTSTGFPTVPREQDQTFFNDHQNRNNPADHFALSFYVLLHSPCLTLCLSRTGLLYVSGL